MNISSTFCLPSSVSFHLTGAGVMVRARVMNCIDGVNVALLQKAINEQRRFFKERECEQSTSSQPADAKWSGSSFIKFPRVLMDCQGHSTGSEAVCQGAQEYYYIYMTASSVCGITGFCTSPGDTVWYLKPEINVVIISFHVWSMKIKDVFVPCSFSAMSLGVKTSDNTSF